MSVKLVTDEGTYVIVYNTRVGMVILVLLCAFFCVAFFSFYFHQCTEERARGISPSGAVAGMSRKRGLDPVVIESFPVFVYSKVKDLKHGKGALECAVCLSEFEDEETLRLMPQCDHVFYPDCIGAWLASHMTCPVCRANLTPERNETFKSTESNNELTQRDSVSVSSREVIIDVKDEESSSELQVPETANTRDATPMTNKILSLQADLVPIAIQEGFTYHYVEPGYVMLTYWIPDEPCTLPASPSHQIGVGGFVMNDKREIESSKFSHNDILLRILCPVSRISGIIGEDGTIVSQISEEIGAQIRVVETVPGCDEREVVISGSEKETEASILEQGKEDIGQEAEEGEEIDSRKEDSQNGSVIIVLSSPIA